MGRWANERGSSMNAYLLALAAFLSSLALAWGARVYALHRGLQDVPGGRRLHARVTPRGGGIGIVLALLLCVPWLHWPGGGMQPLWLGLAVLAVAAIGWIDDHRPLSARLRLAVHGLAALLCAGVVVQTGHLPLPWAMLALGLAVLWLAGCINAWNFMDGSNGLVTIQSFWLALAMLSVFTLIALDGVPAALPWVGVSLILAAACGGFLPLNFPRALIFLGDVGSGALGLICGLLLLVAFNLAPERFWTLLLLPSAVLLDAGLTLLLRLLSGRRWYRAHREHLYQWLIRCGWRHEQVALVWLGWNLLIVLPACLLMQRRPDIAPGVALLVLGAGVWLWWFGKGALWRRARRRKRGKG